MATVKETRRRAWLIPVAVLLLGGLCTVLLWYAAGSALERLSRSHAEAFHLSAHRHIHDALARHESLAGVLASSLADSIDPRQTLERAAPPLLYRFPELIALEWYTTDAAGDGPMGAQHWRQTALISRGQSPADEGFNPSEVPGWEAVVNRAWTDLTPGVTPVQPGSGVLSNSFSSRPSMHLFWPVADSPVVTENADPPALLGFMLSPEQLLAALPNETPGATIDYRLLDSETGNLIASAGADDPTQPAEADLLSYEDRLSLTDRNWLLRTTFNFQSPPETQGLLQAIVAFGAALALLAALLCLRLARRAGQHEDEARLATQRWKSERRAGQNATIEKDILGRALMDSEQRTRDFVELSSAFSCELDEDGRIGFISSQVAAILDCTPADLGGRPMLDLLPAEDREHFLAAVDTCCRERRTVNLEVSLLQGNEKGCPISLNITPVTDGINRCVGYRAVGWRRENAYDH